MDNKRGETQGSDNDALLDSIKAQAQSNVRPGQKLAAYLQGVLVNRQWTLDDLARKLGHQTTLRVRALLSGQMPSEAIDEDLIEDLARAIERSPNVIRVILGRNPHLSTKLDTLLEEQTGQSEAMVEALLRLLPGRYSEQIDGDNHRSKQYDFVIRQLEKFIARQKRELDEARRLVMELQQDNPDESIKIDLRRIINRIIELDSEIQIREDGLLFSGDEPAATGDR